jgi:hypothetical protein
MVPYLIGQRVIYEGNPVVITGMHPHSDSFRYVAHRADLLGPEVHFTHEEAIVPEDTTRTLSPDVAPVLEHAGLDPVRFDLERARIEEEQARQQAARKVAALEDLLDVVREVNTLFDIPDLQVAWDNYARSTP